MIRIRHLAPLLAAIMLIGILVFQGYQLRTLLYEREMQYSERQLRNVAARAQASLNHRFELGDMVLVRQAMSDVGLYQRETEAFLLGPDNRVLAADRLGFDGTDSGRLPVAIDGARLSLARSSLQGVVATNEAQGAMTAYYPVSMTKTGERPYDKAAVLVVNLHYEQGLKEVRTFIRKSVRNSLVIVLLMVGAVSLTLHLKVIRRITGLRETINRYRSGALDARSTDETRDEIGDIAQAFNQVADTIAERQLRLERSQDELSTLNQTLEQRVLERTRALELEVEERRRTEDALQSSQQELKTVLELAPDGMVVINDKGLIYKFNSAAERMFGRTEAEVMGRNVNLLMPDPHRSAHDGYLANYEATGIAKVIGREREVEAMRSDGTVFPIALSVSQFTLRGERHYIGIVRDISERKAAEQAVARAQQRLLEAEKMVSLGSLVAGVAHEINIPVGVGVTAISHLQDEVHAFADRYRAGQMKRSDLEQFLTTSTSSAQIVEDNLRRASQLIRSFKEIAVDQTGDDVRDITIGDYVDSVLISLHPRLKNRPITVSTSVQPEGLKVRLQAGGLSQIVTNLVLNSLIHAFDADDAGEIAFAIVRRGSGIVLTYSDTGRGMAADVAERVFEPFFTTKRGQGGSGLGMNIIYNIVTQKFAGDIHCESAPGKGTRFIISIPDCVIDAG